ncbi:MAG: AAA family ATPase [Burkholderiales bacterium]
MIGPRIVVIGTSGAGKSTFARKLASSLRCDYVELDTLHWDANWTEREQPDFEARVRARTAGDRWVVDGNYSSVRHLTWARATDIVWLDFSRTVVWSRVIRRTLWRSAVREELWAGNRESLARALFSKDSILLWSFSTFGRNRAKFAAARASGEHARLRWHVLRSPREADRLLRALG